MFLIKESKCRNIFNLCCLTPIRHVAVSAATALALAGCATQPSNFDAGAPGFVSGLFHGFLIVFSFVLSLVSDYRIYAYPNSGGWYDFGFLIGALMFFGGAANEATTKN